MTAQKPASETTEKQGNLDKVAGQPAKKSAPKRTDKPAESAPKPVKLVRKGRRPSEGARLTRAFARKSDSYERSTLIGQAARAADRLEVLNRMLSGDADAWLAVKVAGSVVSVVVTDVVREERQQSELLRRLIMDIQKLGDGTEPGAGGGKKVDTLAEIVKSHYGRKRT